MAPATPRTQKKQSATVDKYLTAIERSLDECLNSSHLGPSLRLRMGFNPDDALKKLATLGQKLLSIKNACAPISRLPNEVLELIFLNLQMSERTWSGLEVEDFSPSSDWWSVLLVCKHWNTVAMKCGMLWKTISMRMFDKHGRALCQARTIRELGLTNPNSLRIHLFGGDHRDAPEGVDDFLTTALPRTRDLYINDTICPATLKTLTTTPCPRLRSLIVNARLAAFFDSGDLPTLFGGNFPLLESLSVTQLTYGANVFCNLKQLHLRNNTYEFACQIDGLGAILSANPGLEDLAFESIKVDRTELEAPPSVIASLPNLRRLFFNDMLLEDAQYLAHLMSSKSTELSVCCTSWKSGEIHGLLYVLGENFSSLSNFRTLKVSFTDGNTVAVSALKDTCAINCEWDIGEESPLRGVRRVFDRMMLLIDSIEELWIHAQYAGLLSIPPSQFDKSLFHLDQFKNLLRTPVNLRKLVLNVDCVYGIVHILESLLEVKKPGTKLPELCVTGPLAFTIMPFYETLSPRLNPGCRRPVVRVYGSADSEDYPRWRQYRNNLGLHAIEVVTESSPYVELPDVYVNQTGRWRWPTKVGGWLDY